MSELIFLSYRRQDEPDFTKLIYEHLVASFGAGHVFMDVEGDIRAGKSFVEYIQAKIERCDVVVAVVGRDWATDQRNRSRIEQPDDYVRMEIELARKLNKAIIPVLVNYAAMPEIQALPDSLRFFAVIQAFGLQFLTREQNLLGLSNVLQRQLDDAASLRSLSLEEQREAAARSRFQESQERAHTEELEAQIRELQAQLEARANETPAKIKEAVERERWDLIQQSRESRHIRDHLARYPGGITEAPARKLLATLEWQELGDRADKPSIGKFLAEFPEAKLTAYVIERLTVIEADEREAEAERNRRLLQAERARAQAMALAAQIRITNTDLRGKEKAQETPEVEERRLWDLIRHSRDTQQICEHLARYRLGATGASARALLAEIAWGNLGPEPDDANIRSFLSEFPEAETSGYLQERRSALNVQREADTAQRARDAQATNTNSKQFAQRKAGQKSEFLDRVIFTLVCLFAFRVGTFIPLPGLNDPGVTIPFEPGGLLALQNLLTGGAVERGSIFALGLAPAFFGALLAAYWKAGENSEMQGVMRRGAAYCSVVGFAGGLAVAVALEAGGLTTESGWLYRFTVAATISASGVFLFWLAQRLTVRGIGSGAALLTASGILAAQVPLILGFIDSPSISPSETVPVLLLVLVVAFIVRLDGAERRMLLLYSLARGQGRLDYLPIS